MADRVKGITIEIGGDTTKLSTAIKNVDKEIKGTQSDLRDVEKLLKLDPTNIELLAQKQELLAKNVANVTSKLELLKEAESQAQEQFAKGEITQEQYNSLQREIVATEQALQKATEQQKAFNLEGEKLKNVSANFKKVSDVAGTVADKTKLLSAGAGALITGLGGLAMKSVALSDDLNTLANQSGLTTEEIQKFQFAQDVVDVSADSIVSALTKMRKSMASTSSATQEAWNKIGVSTKTADGQLRDSTEVFYETLEALSQIENETERDVLAMDLFGKSADQLAGIIDDGGQALKELGTQAEESGLILSQDTLDSLNAVNDKIDIMKATITSLLATTGAKAMETLQPTFDMIIEKVSAILEWVGGLDGDTLKLIITVAGLVAAISPIAGIISKISGALSGVISFLPTIIEFATANPILLIISAIALLTALIIENWDKIKPVLVEIKETIQDVINSIINWVSDKVNAVVEFFNKIKEIIKDTITSVVNWFKDRINAVIGFFNGIIDGINKLINGINKIQFDFPEWLGGGHFGLNIPTLQNIPMLANGGVVGVGVSAIVGERGAEMLTNVGGNAVVTPLTAQVDTNAITSAIRDGQGTQNVNIQFSGNLAQLGRVLQPVIVNENRRLGGSLINV